MSTDWVDHLGGDLQTRVTYETGGWAEDYLQEMLDSVFVEPVDAQHSIYYL